MRTQDAEIPPNEEKLVCSLQSPPAQYVSRWVYLLQLDNGYWGRDHGDDEGTPPDGLLRTTWGTYPAGGKFDDNSFDRDQRHGRSRRERGLPYCLSAFDVDFMQAEMALAQGQTRPAARDFMLAGFDKQMAKVQAFLVGREAGADTSFEPSAGDIATYRATISIQLRCRNHGWINGISLGVQFFIANYGNGVEPYNFYRRTLYPTTLQPNREPDPGTFIMSMYYPSNSVNNNSNISQKPDQAQPVFWDNSGVPPAN